MIAEALNDAQAAWLITGLGAIGFLVGIAVGIKKLFWPNDKISPQPLLIAMEKEFVNRQEYERRHGDLENQVKEARTYAHERIHEIGGVIGEIRLTMQDRNERLAALEADMKTTIRVVGSFDQKLDRLIASDGEHRGRFGNK